MLNGDLEPYQERINDFIIKELPWHNIVFKQTTEAGVSNARNIGLDLAKGDYITFVDDDDVVSSDYLAGLMAKASPNTISISYTESFTDSIIKTSRDYILTKEFIEKSSKGKIPFYQASRFFQGPCMKLFKKEIINNRRYDPKLKNGEDSLFMFLISDKMKYVDFTNMSSMYYRRIRKNGANYSKKNIRYKIKNTYYLIKNYFLIYIRSPKKYSFNFFVTRLVGAIKACVC